MEISEKTPRVLGTLKNNLPLQLQKKLERAGIKNSVYESLLKDYRKLRGSEFEKIANAERKIDKSKAELKEKKDLSEKAKNAGDLEAFEKANTDIVKLEESIKLYQRYIADIKNNSPIDPEAAKDFYTKANEEIAVIKDRYTKEVFDALAPIVEICNKAYLQVSLLEMAKEKISGNLEHAQQAPFKNPVSSELFLMNEFNRIFQNENYKQLNPYFTKEEKRSVNKWTLPAEECLKQEAQKWI